MCILKPVLQRFAMQHLSCVYCYLQIFWSMFYPGFSVIFFSPFYLFNQPCVEDIAKPRQ